MGLVRVRRWDPLLVALAVLALTCLFSFGLRRAELGTQVVMYWALMAIVQSCFAIFSWRVVLASRPRPGETAAEAARTRAGRSMWQLFGAAGFVLMLGNTIQLGVVSRDPESSVAVLGADAQVVSIAIGMALMIAGMLRYPLADMSTPDRLRMRIDVATVMSAAITFSLYVFDLPAGPYDLAWTAHLAAAMLVQPGLFLVAIFAVVKILLGGQSPFTRAAGLICGLTAALQGVLQAVPISLYLYPAAMSWLFAANILCSALIAIGARVQERQAGAEVTGGDLGARRRPYSLLPFAAMGAAWTLTFAVMAVHGPSLRTWLVWVGATVTTVLVIARQTAAFRHIAELLRERDELTVRLADLAYRDALTGLANRGRFMTRLTEGLQAGAVTVFLVDLNDFKPVNDEHGHAAGDRLLVEVGRRLRACVRAEDTVARLGGDEFAVLTSGLPADRCAELGGDMVRALNGTLPVGVSGVPFSASVGWATGVAASHDPDSLLHDADMAMYADKDRYRARIH
jgi:diguanylate cyclase